MSGFITSLAEQLEGKVLTLADTYHLQCAILFGSYARGDYAPQSDIDIILIGEFVEKFINRNYPILRDFNIGTSTDIFCYTPDEFHHMFFRGRVHALDAIDEGICVFGKVFFKKYRQVLKKLKSFGLKKDPPVWIIPDAINNPTLQKMT